MARVEQGDLVTRTLEAVSHVPGVVVAGGAMVDGAAALNFVEKMLPLQQEMVSSLGSYVGGWMVLLCFAGAEYLTNLFLQARRLD